MIGVGGARLYFFCDESSTMAQHVHLAGDHLQAADLLPVRLSGGPKSSRPRWACRLEPTGHHRSSHPELKSVKAASHKEKKCDSSYTSRQRSWNRGAQDLQWLRPLWPILAVRTQMGSKSQKSV